ncbi:MAG: NAD(P)/FAD-dependent oxidoreductase [Gordonia amarae]
MSSATDYDVLIVGAGISGIDAAYRIQEQCPELSYRLVEARDQLGGTWDLFRYPGIRSDSDFFTLSFPFHPWRGKDSIVDGDEILDYLHEVTSTHGIDEHISYRTRIIAADWNSEDARWIVQAEVDGQPEQLVVRFIVGCTGYYDYEEPYDAQLPGRERFKGQLVHPQFWPEDLDPNGKTFAVIGSGATAVTLVPSLVKLGAHVTMVQRTPTYILAEPRQDPVADLLRSKLPAGRAHQIMRMKNTALQWGLFQVCRRAPKMMRNVLRKGAISGTGSEALVDTHFNPPYDPWDQRLCIAPGGDLFTAIKDGGAEIVTGNIRTITEDGIELTDGTKVSADIIVTATGLSMCMLGKVQLSVDGTPVNPSETVVFRGTMLSGVPNFAMCVGYINLSWTMRADMTARLVSRILKRLSADDRSVVVPVYTGERPDSPFLDMQSGYLRRGAPLMPRAAKEYPWTMAQNVIRDAWHTNRADLDDGLVWTGERQKVTAG